MAAVVATDDGRGLSVEACRRDQPNKSKLSLYKPIYIAYVHTYVHMYICDLILENRPSCHK